MRDLNECAVRMQEAAMVHEKLKIMESYQICVEAIERAIAAEAENAKLRKVAEVAKDWQKFDYFVGIPIEDDGADNQAKRAYYEFMQKLGQALQELEGKE